MGAVSEVLIPTLPMVVVSTLIAMLFFVSLLLFRTILRGMNTKEIRRALALAVTCAYIGIVTMAISGLIDVNEKTLAIIDGLNKAFMVVVAFYFGTRVIETGLDRKYGDGKKYSANAAKATAKATAEEHPRKEDEASG